MIELLGKKLLFFDGAMGTMLHGAGIRPGEIPDVWNITNADDVVDIHRKYLKAGSDIITTNTFGTNNYKLKNSGFTAQEIAAKAVINAKNAVQAYSGGKPRFVALDIGSTGRLLKPIGDLGFEDAYVLFRETITAGACAGVDIILIETMSDAYELKAAVLAAKENCSLPVIASVTLDQNGRLLTGGDIAVVVALLEGLRADAIGLNCSLGPREMFPFLEELLRISSLPVLFMPNAGLPCNHGGETVYDINPDEFGLCMRQAAQKGACMLGGCCGTTPEHIAALVRNCRDISPPEVKKKNYTVASSYGRTVYFGAGKPVLIGERINPTGKARLKQALREADYDYVLREGIAQQEQGADALDVNVGLPEIDETAVLLDLVLQLQSVTDLPLQIDTADAGAMARVMRMYNGKPIINSVNGKESSMAAIFPLVQKYGGVVIALTLDESGIPETAEGRVEIAKKILKRAEGYGIDSKDIVFDVLAMAVSAGHDNARITLECLRRIKEELGANTSLGISNVSFGLPRRDLLNAAFLSLALDAGLDAAIMNPHAESMMNAAATFTRGEKVKPDDVVAALLGKDTLFENYIAAYSGQQTPKAEAAAPLPENLTLGRAVLKGLKQQAGLCARRDLETAEPLDLIELELVPALNEAGERFEKGTLFLPQLLMSAEAAKAAFEVIRSKMGDAADTDMGTVVLATVEGDVHDIGKNIVRALLENYRFKVIDLGKDVPSARIVEAALESRAGLVGLSALMTTTVPAMAQTIRELRQVAPECRIMVGGAVLTKDYAKSIGADNYGKDAMAAVRYAQEVYKRKRG